MTRRSGDSRTKKNEEGREHEEENKKKKARKDERLNQNEKDEERRHVSHTHRVALDPLFDEINVDPIIHVKYVDTQNQLADILTKGSFTRNGWDKLLRLFNIENKQERPEKRREQSGEKLFLDRR